MASAHRLVEELVTSAGALGYGAYRAHVNLMDHVGDQYRYNDHIQRRVAERIKDALDPAGILSPGKQGVWPAHLRSDAS